ncbi:bifunctional lytic transglycosylase/C40 family peptidase [Bacillus pseudomycoides]|uniref:bifunctional lytic transglycosylase/C40 family peptidase n=1 Tax=Bacillus pseudomycoides TaxID=64104 RepID=UPI0020D26CFA|nr:bifunctional lytic transglycosylase/C40 family peptidase [Bacillus pseudomycoides]
MIREKTSNQSNSNFRQQESAMKELDKNVETAEQRNISQAKNAIDSQQQDIGQGKLQNQSSKLSNHTSKEFQQPEGTVIIKDVKKQEILETSQQKQLGETENSLLKERDKNSEKLVFDNPKAQKGIQFVEKLGKDSLIATKDTLKDSVKKYQKELEKGDEGVRVASQGATQIYRLSAKSFKILKQNKFHVKNLTKGKTGYLRKERKSKETDLNKFHVKKGKTEYLQKEKKNKETNLKKKDKETNLKKKDKKTSLKGLDQKTDLKGLDKKTNLKKLAKVPINVLGSGALKYQKQLEKGDEGVKLASQSVTKIARATKNLAKNRIKANAKLGKMGKQQSKLVPFPKDKLKVESRNILKKKAIKKKMYYSPLRDKNKTKALTSIASNVKNQVANLFKSLGKFNLQNVKKLIGTKVAAIFGGGLASAVPLLLIGMICLLIAGAFGAGSSSQEEQIGGNIGGTKNLSPEVEKWRSLVEKEATAQGMEAYISLILAIIQVESGGTGTPDIMQSSESAGYGRPDVFQTEEESVRQGVKHLKECLLILKSFNKGYENNIKALAQAYNFGNAFSRFVGNKGGEYSIEVAEAYSRDVVAPSLGNTTGITVPYFNETSIRVGKTYRYINGGNFLYGELVSEYIGGGAGANISGDFRKVLDEIEKYQGWPYVWGGKNPTQGFDCSGLTSWGLKVIGIDLPSYALSQYELTTPISESEAQPGDLIFFKGTYGGPDHISHVAFYIDANTMYDSQSAGIGYHDWKTSYWQQHFAGIHRVKR